MTSPSGLSWVTAPAKVRHGVLTLSHELALLPERAETKTWFARPRAGVVTAMDRVETQRHAKKRRAFMKTSFEDLDSSRENLMPPFQEPARNPSLGFSYSYAGTGCCTEATLTFT